MSIGLQSVNPLLSATVSKPVLFCSTPPFASLSSSSPSSSPDVAPSSSTSCRPLEAVKVCAVSRAVDARMITRVCAELLPPQVDRYMGMILWPHSKRSVCDRGLIRELGAIARDGGMQPVAVFVDETVDQVMELCNACDLDMIQLHGAPVRQAWLNDGRTSFADMKYIDVQDVVDEDDHNNSEKVAVDRQPDASTDRDLLLPRRQQGERGESLSALSLPTWTIFDAKGGGTGVPFDWNRFTPPPPPYPWLLAGGLHPDNVATAVQTLRPCGLDVASGVAGSDKIVKDERRLVDFIERAVKAYQ